MTELEGQTDWSLSGSLAVGSSTLALAHLSITVVFETMTFVYRAYFKLDLPVL